MALGAQTFGQTANPLPAGSVVSSAVAAQVTARVAALNTAISAVAQQKGAIVYDLNGFFARARTQGIMVGSRTLTADFQGGLYSLDGAYPGMVVHALIANEILALLNKTFSMSYPMVDATALLTSDPAVRITPLLRRPRNNSGGDSR
jgi:phospholipase/lecithinase/hemolysin